MRKRLDTRFPAARIKKIMQSDDDVGKIAMAVPLLVSKALELFLQDLCDRTYEITSTRGAKIMSSSHLKACFVLNCGKEKVKVVHKVSAISLKQCVQSFNIFDFLREIVSEVPDLGDSSVVRDDRLVGRKRKFADFEDDNGGDQSRSKMHATAPSGVNGRGRGRGRGRGHKRGSRATQADNFEDDPDMNDLQTTSQDYEAESLNIKAHTSSAKNTSSSVRNFDLNLDLDENGNPASVSTEGSNNTTDEFDRATVQVEHPSWSFGEMQTLPNCLIMFSSLSRGIEDDENYDVEE